MSTMNPVRTLLAVGVAVAIGCVIAGVMTVRREAAQQAADQAPRATESAPMALKQPASQQINTSPDITSEARPVKAEAQPPKDPRAVEPAAPVSESDARAALSLVGADPDAEGIWITAINDPNLPPEARQNLIEDLNEDGLSDPKNPSVDDLPLIVSRIELIEELAPDAMDDVNWDAFREAYKDLITMYARLTQL